MLYFLVALLYLHILTLVLGWARLNGRCIYIFCGFHYAIMGFFLIVYCFDINMYD